MAAPPADLAAVKKSRLELIWGASGAPRLRYLVSDG
jgi:hypothetical protein